jgi:two-component system LytT family sensor kinase
MSKNPALGRFIWGVSLFAALFINFPIIFFNLPKLRKSGLAVADVVLQVIISLVYMVVAIHFMYKQAHSSQPKIKQIISSSVMFVGFVVVLMSVNIIFIKLPFKILPTVLMRGALLTLLGIFFSRFILETERKNEVLLENEQLKHENLLVQLNSLKNQLNPHFLFNSLNTLSWLINEDKDRSQLYLQKLSQVLRYSLSIQEQSLVKLQEELELVESYIFLLQIRFGNNLKVHWQTDKTTSFLIPPLSIQLLIENAVKHNIISTHSPLEINIITDNNKCSISVSNTLRIRTHSEGTGLGLVNLNERFRLLASKEIEIEQSQELFCVTLPLLLK